MKIAVLGATGTIGRRVVEEARRRGHEVVEVSRGGPVKTDVTDGG